MAGLCAQYYGCSVLIFSVADVDVKERVDDSLVEILNLRFGRDFEPEFDILNLKFCQYLKYIFVQDVEAEIWSRF